VGERGLYSRKERFGGLKLIFSFIKKIIKNREPWHRVWCPEALFFWRTQQFKKLADAFVIS